MMMRRWMTVVALTAFAASACGDGLSKRVEGELVVEAGGGAAALFTQFPAVRPASSGDSMEDIIIKNGGQGTLTVTSVTIVADETGYIQPKTTIPATPFSLTPESTERIVLRLSIPDSNDNLPALTCPEPVDLPEAIPADRYCGYMDIKSDSRIGDSKKRIYFLVSQTAGQIKVNPTVLTFDNPQVGRTLRQSFTITNESTSGDLEVKKITKVNFSAGISSLFAVEGFAFPFTLLPGESTMYDVVYNPQSTDAVSGRIEIESNDISQGKVTLTVQTGSASAAQIECTPESLLFPQAGPGAPETKEINCTNTGNGAALLVNNFDVRPAAADAVYTVMFERDGAWMPWTGGTTDTLARQNSKTYRVVYAPTADSGSVAGTLRIQTNASNVPSGELEIELSGNQAAPNGRVDPSSIIFDAQPGDTVERAFSIRNEGLAPLAINSVAFTQQLDEAEMSITPDPAGVNVAPGELRSFLLTYSRMANDVGADQGSIAFDTNNQTDLSIFVRNNAQDNAFAPVCDITQDPDGAVTTGTTINLDSSGSEASSGDITYTVWTLVDRPTDSTAELDGETDAAVTFTPDVAGSYSVQLTVGNSLDLECGQIREITVTE
jgi:hypothetical protein